MRRKNWHGERKARKHTVFNFERIGHNFYFMYGRYTLKYSRLVVSTYLSKNSKYIFSLQWKKFRLFLPRIELGTLCVLSTCDKYYTTETWHTRGNTWWPLHYGNMDFSTLPKSQEVKNFQASFWVSAKPLTQITCCSKRRFLLIWILFKTYFFIR